MSKSTWSGSLDVYLLKSLECNFECGRANKLTTNVWVGSFNPPSSPNRYRNPFATNKICIHLPSHAHCTHSISCAVAPSCDSSSQFSYCCILRPLADGGSNRYFLNARMILPPPPAPPSPPASPSSSSPFPLPWVDLRVRIDFHVGTWPFLAGCPFCDGACKCSANFMN